LLELASAGFVPLDGLSSLRHGPAPVGGRAGDDSRAVATATGLVNGVGSGGGTLEELSLPAISAHFGWQAIFPLLSGLAVCAADARLPKRWPPAGPVRQRHRETLVRVALDVESDRGSATRGDWERRVPARGSEATAQ